MRFSCWIYSVNGDTIFIERLQSKKEERKDAAKKYVERKIGRAHV